jgi:hypothetical protein
VADDLHLTAGGINGNGSEATEERIGEATRVTAANAPSDPTEAKRSE